MNRVSPSIFRSVLVLALLLALGGFQPSTWASEFTFAIASDTHLSTEKPRHNARFTHVLGRIRDLKPAFVIITGDVFETWSEANTSLYRDLTANYPIPIHLIPGNHDVGGKRSPDGQAGITSETVRRWNSVFGEDHFAFDHEGVLFVGIDNALLGSGLPEEALQKTWFEGRLRDAAGRRVFVFAHYAFFLRDPKETDGGYWTIEKSALDPWLELLRLHPVSAVWTGHLHRFNDAVWQGIPFVTTPATSFSCAADRALTGFRSVRVAHTGWQHEFIDLRTAGDPPKLGTP